MPIEKNNKSEYLEQVQTDVSLLSFMTAVSMFFSGLLLTRFDSFNLFIKVPLSFLIISTFGFLFSSLILSNASQKIIDEKFEKASQRILYGYVISEYLGIYLFVLSIPLVISAITSDFYLRMITLCAAIIGIALYQFMGFSLLEDHFPRNHKIFSLLIVLFGLILFIAQLRQFHFVLISIIFLCFILLITYLAPRKNFQ